MATWTEELKNKVIEMYEAAEPTPATSTEIVKDIAEELDQSANGVRQVLVQAGVYLKKEVTSEKPATKEGSNGTKRTSKETQYEELRKAIKAKGQEPDDEIITKLTGKAAAYLAGVLNKGA